MSGGIGQAGIGQFVIGQSSIGVVTQPFDWTQPVYSQYANSPVLLQLVEDFAAWLDPAAQIDAFFGNVWDPATAVGWGLDVWGRIVGAQRFIQAPASKFLGFEEAGTLSADPFGQSPLFDGNGLQPQNYALSDDAFRSLIFAKAAANIWDGSIPGLNRIVRLLFPGQVCYVSDDGAMSMTYHFKFTLSPVQQTIIISSGVLPHPAGVSVNYVQG